MRSYAQQLCLRPYADDMLVLRSFAELWLNQNSMTHTPTNTQIRAALCLSGEVLWGTNASVPLVYEPLPETSLTSPPWLDSPVTLLGRLTERFILSSFFDFPVSGPQDLEGIVHLWLTWLRPCDNWTESQCSAEDKLLPLMTHLRPLYTDVLGAFLEVLASRFEMNDTPSQLRYLSLLHEVLLAFDEHLVHQAPAGPAMLKCDWKASRSRSSSVDTGNGGETEIMLPGLAKPSLRPTSSWRPLSAYALVPKGEGVSRSMVVDPTVGGAARLCFASMHASVLARNWSLRMMDSLGVPPSHIPLLLSELKARRNHLVQAWDAFWAGLSEAWTDFSSAWSAAWLLGRRKRTRGPARQGAMWPLVQLGLRCGGPLLLLSWLLAWLLNAESLMFVLVCTTLSVVGALLLLADLAVTCEHTVYVKHGQVLVLFGKLFAREDEAAWRRLGLNLQPHAVGAASLLHSVWSTFQQTRGSLIGIHQDPIDRRSTYALCVSYLRALEQRRQPWRACTVALWLTLCLASPASASLDRGLALAAATMLLWYPPPLPHGPESHRLVNTAVVCSFEVPGLVRVAAWASKGINLGLHHALRLRGPPREELREPGELVQWVNFRGLANRNRLLVLLTAFWAAWFAGPESSRTVATATGTAALLLLHGDLARNHSLYFRGVQQKSKRP